MYLVFMGEPVAEDETEVRYPVARRVMSKDRQTLTFYSVPTDPGEAEGPIQTRRGDGFVLAEDEVDGFARRTYSGGTLVYTNVPEPEPVPPEPEPEASDTEVLNTLLGVDTNE